MNNILINQVAALNTPKTESPNNINTKRVFSSVPVERLEKINGADPFDKPSKMLLSLLKTSFSDEKPDLEIFKGANHSDWLKMVEIADESSVSAMAADAVAKMPKNTIPTRVIVNLLKVANEAEQRHAQQEKIIGAFSERLAQKGIETVQLKGIGLSMGYPVPQHRFGGDIDVFTRLKGTVTNYRSNSSDIVDDMIAADGVKIDDYKVPRVKHSEFIQDGVRIENHRYFVNRERLYEAKKIDEYLHKTLNPVEKILPHGTKILVPSKEFNTVFLAQHAFQHFVFGGLDMHHLTDWCVHIKANGLEFPEELKGTNLEKFTYALTNLSNKYLGTKVKAPEDKKYEGKIFDTMLHPVNEKTPEGLSKPEILLFKAKRIIKKSKHAKEYGGRSITRIFIQRAFEKLKDPAVLFR